MRLQNLIPLGALIAVTAVAACSSSNSVSTLPSAGGTNSLATGGKSNLGGAGGSTAGGSANVGGRTGNTTAGGTTGNVATGGSATAGGNTSIVTTGGTKATGGAGPGPTGGTATGPTGGVSNVATGGKANVGGSAGAATGGTIATGGSATGPTGGTATGPTGGTNNVATGGIATAGGNTSIVTTGGTKATGGAGPGPTGGTNNVATGGTSVVATGGTATVATGGTTGGAVTPATPACPAGNNSEGVPNAANPPAANIISDFDTNGDAISYPCVTDPLHTHNPCTDTHLINYKNGARGGVRWYSYTDYVADPDTSAVSKSLPVLSWDGAQTSGTCTTGTTAGSMKIVGTGNVGWGSGIGVDLTPRNALNQKVPFNATAYSGIGFNMKCSTDVPFLYFKTIDALNDGDCTGPSCGISSVCVYSGAGTICNQWGYKNVNITKTWSNYEIYFTDTLQDPASALNGTGIDKTKLTALQMQFNTPKDTTGANPVQTPYTCWIDDVHFLTAPSPAPVTTCASAYTTSGNQIRCGATQKIFRGVARPSLEWDPAGWNMNPPDFARIKNGWKANLIRFSLNQDTYMGTSVPATAQSYPKYVARAVKWAEAAGMDVILDLHWVDKAHPSSTSGYMAGPSTNSPAFWTAVAGAFKGDNHVMFELYNEPTISDWATWKSNYQALYSAVRNAGANQITIIGGLDWAYDLSGVTANAITGTNIVYNTHPYGNKATSTADMDTKFGNLAKTVPVMATEFGTYDCTGTWTTNMINYFEDPSRTMSWTAWAWYVVTTPGSTTPCNFPSVISDYSGTVLGGGNAAASKTGLTKNP